MEAPKPEMKSAVRRRLEEARLTGGGSAFPENYQAQGMSRTEAEKRAEEVRRFAREGVVPGAEEEASQEPQGDPPPPDLGPITEKETEEARNLASLLREAQARVRPFPGEDPWKRFLSDLERMREPLEKSLEPIDPLQLLFHESIEQVVPLIQGKLKVRFRSLTALEYNLVERWIVTHPSLRGTPPFLIEKLNGMMLLALSIEALSEDRGPSVPSVQDQGFGLTSQDFEQIYGKALISRLEWLMRRPVAVVDLLRMNFIWFEQRIHRVVSDASYLDHHLKKS
jgi:hypothetical protein